MLKLTLTYTRHIDKITRMDSLSCSQTQANWPYSLFKWRHRENPGTQHFVHGSASLCFSSQTNQNLDIRFERWQRKKYCEEGQDTWDKSLLKEIELPHSCIYTDFRHISWYIHLLINSDLCIKICMSIFQHTEEFTLKWPPWSLNRQKQTSHLLCL